MVTKRRWTIPVVLLCLTCLSMVVGPGPYHELRDRLVWQRLSRSIMPDKVESVEFRLSVSEPVTIRPALKEYTHVVHLLKTAEFNRSNWWHSGPTPEAVVTVYMITGDHLHFGYWGSGLLELSHGGSHFLISSPALGKMLEQYLGERQP